MMMLTADGRLVMALQMMATRTGNAAETADAAAAQAAAASQTTAANCVA